MVAVLVILLSVVLSLFACSIKEKLFLKNMYDAFEEHLSEHKTIIAKYFGNQNRKD